MTYKHFYRAILIRLIILVLIAGAATWLILQKHYWLAGISVLLLVMEVVSIIKYFNRIN